MPWIRAGSPEADEDYKRREWIARPFVAAALRQMAGDARKLYALNQTVAGAHEGKPNLHGVKCTYEAVADAYAKFAMHIDRRAGEIEKGEG